MSETTTIIPAFPGFTLRRVRDVADSEGGYLDFPETIIAWAILVGSEKDEADWYAPQPMIIEGVLSSKEKYVIVDPTGSVSIPGECDFVSLEDTQRYLKNRKLGKSVIDSVSEL